MVPHGTSLNAGLCRRTIFCWRTKRTKINRTGGCGSEFFLVFTVSCLRHVFFFNIIMPNVAMMLMTVMLMLMMFHANADDDTDDHDGNSENNDDENDYKGKEKKTAAAQ